MRAIELALTAIAVVATAAGALAEAPQPRLHAHAPETTTTPPNSAGSGSCALKRFSAGHVKTVIDGRTFVFVDGREIRLAAIEVAPLSADGNDGAGEAARRALAALISNREVTLMQIDGQLPSTDRYGRIVAYGLVTDTTPERSLQESLLALGHARVAARIEAEACLPRLRAQEDAARRAARGLWGDPTHAVVDAGEPGAIASRRGHFIVIAGKVISVRDSRGTIYINFSRRWSTGFSAFVRKGNVRLFAAAGLDPKRLAGRRVEVRGFVEQRRGPLIAIERPEQIALRAD